MPIAILLIQLLDIPFPHKEKFHCISSSFWMPGRIFTTVYIRCTFANLVSHHCTLIWQWFKVAGWLFDKVIYFSNQNSLGYPEQFPSHLLTAKIDIGQQIRQLEFLFQRKRKLWNSSKISTRILVGKAVNLIQSLGLFHKRSELCPKM